MLALDFPICLRNQCLRMPKPNLATQVQSEDAIELFCIFSLSFVAMFSAPISSSPTFVPHPPFVVDLLAEALLVVLHVPSQMQYQTGFGFSNFLLAFLVSLYSSWAACPWGFLSYASFLCLSCVKSSLFICLAFLPLLLGVAYQCRPSLNLKVVVLENQPAVLLLAGPWPNLSLLFWGPELLSCYLFHSFLMLSWIPSRNPLIYCLPTFHLLTHSDTESGTEKWVG